MIFPTRKITREIIGLVIGKTIVGFRMEPTCFHTFLSSEEGNEMSDLIIHYKISESEILPYVFFQSGIIKPDDFELFVGFDHSEIEILEGHLGHKVSNFDLEYLSEDKTCDFMIDSQYTGFRGMRSIRTTTNSFSEALKNQDIGLNWTTIF